MSEKLKFQRSGVLLRHIRSIDRVSLEVLHCCKKCYTPGGAMTAGIITLMPVLFREVVSSLHPVSDRNSS